jgi:membrane protein YdbS with pleckstrin-like domain
MSLALVGLIVCAGYLVSVPAQWQLASAVLVTLYTAFIGASILLTAALWRRRQW